ncbi:MAG: ABC transporter permease [Chloroflexi bacterium]|nr:ABC transporter permease [Chloroflexota bacterium]MDA1004427.1 ABC transporter permease [Chloroflexota bacterium]
MAAYIARRVAVLPLLLLGLATITFAIAHAVPADPISSVVAERQLNNPEVVAAARAHWGLDQSVPEQYTRYVWNLVQGDMGTSFRTKRPVRDDLLERLPATLELTISAMIVATTLGIGLGMVAAVKRNRWPDHVARLFAVTGSAMPVFWIGLVVLLIFWAELGWFPGPGRLDTRALPPPHLTGLFTVDALLHGDLSTFWNAFRHLMLPGFVLGWAVLGLISRLVRASMVEVLGQDYIRTARAKGLHERQVLLRHALKNALIPTLTVVGLSVAGLLGGAVLTEQIFSWPGIGGYTVQAAQSLDYPAIQSVAIFAGALMVLSNLATDVAYAFVDPRIRLS